MADIPILRKHDLRHLLGNTMVSRGATPEEIAALLGHSSTAVTRRYAKAEVESKADSIKNYLGYLED
jgi:integrase